MLLRGTACRASITSAEEVRMLSPSSGPVKRGFAPGGHTGIDFGWRSKNFDFTVRAAASGTVVESATLSDYGIIIKIDHGGGVMTRYCHLASSAPALNASITAGDPVGTMGQTGSLAKGRHLHWEYWLNGKRVDPAPHLDPAIAGIRGASLTPSLSGEGAQKMRVISINSNPVQPTSYPGVAINNCFVLTDVSYAQVTDLNIAKALAAIWNPISGIIPVSAEAAIVTFGVIDHFAAPPTPDAPRVGRVPFDDSSVSTSVRNTLDDEFGDLDLDLDDAAAVISGGSD